MTTYIFKNIKMKTYLIDLGQSRFTYKTRDPCHETMITSQKVFNFQFTQC